jgi:hypothetical protein
MGLTHGVAEAHLPGLERRLDNRMLSDESRKLLEQETARLRAASGVGSGRSSQESGS